MIFDGYFKILGRVKNLDIFKNLQDLLKSYDWKEDQLLVDKIDPAFNDSYCIQFTPSPLMCRIKPTFKKNYLKTTQEVIKVGDLVTAELHELFPDHYHLKSHFVSIKPKGKQIRHIDGHFYHDHARRIVIPIITTGYAKTNFEDNYFVLETGVIYEMNNKLRHWSENDDDEHRIFLFADFIPLKNLTVIKQFFKFLD